MADYQCQEYTRKFATHPFHQVPTFIHSISYDVGFPNDIIQSVTSVTKLCMSPCDPMDYSMPGFPVRHQLP